MEVEIVNHKLLIPHESWLIEQILLQMNILIESGKIR